MKIILDESVPELLGRYLVEHNVRTVRELGIKGIKNGKLLSIVEAGGFEVFISADQHMQKEQNWSRRPFGTLLLSTNNWKLIKPQAAAICQAVKEIKSGEVRNLFCGRFTPTKFRGPAF